jgi:hypothetical protein
MELTNAPEVGRDDLGNVVVPAHRPAPNPEQDQFPTRQLDRSRSDRG